MYTIYSKPINSPFAGPGVESLVVKNDTILAHVRGWDNPQVVDDTFEPTLKGKPVSERGRGWRKLRGEALENAQAWAVDVVTA